MKNTIGRKTVERNIGKKFVRKSFLFSEKIIARYKLKKKEKVGGMKISEIQRAIFWLFKSINLFFQFDNFSGFQDNYKYVRQLH